MTIPDTAVRIEGHAIVSSDGMIAAADGSMPEALRNEADWRLFQAELDQAVLVVLGRIGHARHPNPGRRRLVLTRSVVRLQPDPDDPLATYWNPQGLEFADVLREFAVSEGTVAITGGTGTFDHFVPFYDRFLLSEVRNLEMPGGIPCFSKGHPRFTLPGAGLEPSDMSMIDRGVLQTNWIRKVKTGHPPA